MRTHPKQLIAHIVTIVMNRENLMLTLFFGMPKCSSLSQLRFSEIVMKIKGAHSNKQSCIVP